MKPVNGLVARNVGLIINDLQPPYDIEAQACRDTEANRQGGVFKVS